MQVDPWVGLNDDDYGDRDDLSSSSAASRSCKRMQREEPQREREHVSAGKVVP